MMLDRLLLSDIKEEILEMQYEINATYNPPAPVIPAPVVDFNEVSKTPKIDQELLLSPQKSPMLSPTMKYNSLSSPMGMLQSPLTPGESRLLSHQMTNHSMMDQHKPYPNSLTSPISSVASPYMMPNSPLVQQQQLQPAQERFPPCMHQGKLGQSSGPIVQSVSHLPQIPSQQRPLMVSSPHQQKHSSNRFYSNNIDEPRKSKKSKQVPVHDEPKKDLENFDIESEITPSFIMKSAPVPCENSSEKSPISMQNHSLTSINDQEDTLPSHDSSPMKDMNNSSAGSDDMDIDYFGNPPESHTSIQSNHALSDFDRLKSGESNNETPNQKGGQQDTEPYDEWLCIQKALEEHNTRPLGHHLENRTANGRNTNDLYQQATTQHLNDHANKITEGQFNELFPPTHDPTQHVNHDDKLTDDHSPPSPFAELFNSSDINAGASGGSSNDSSVKETMGQMYGGDSEDISVKNNEIVESRLEALFEGETLKFIRYLLCFTLS